MSGSGRIFPLTAEQAPAVDPAETVWLSASAGTGKTQVLSARVLRLLLQPDVRPSQILCLTFTKAGATEMASRINAVLARWVRLPETVLAKDLLAIGADPGAETIARARRLFAAVLDCPCGGLRIDTIHAFAQWLLAAFPHEAGLLPGVRALEDRDRDLLAREVLGTLLLEAERTNDTGVLGALESLSVKLGPDKVEQYLLRCAKAQEAWTGVGAWQPPMLPRVKQLLGLASDAGPAELVALCDDAAFDVEALRCCQAAYAQWKTPTSAKALPIIAYWLAASPEERFAKLDELHKLLFTGDDLARNRQHLVKFEESFLEAAAAVLSSAVAVRDLKALLNLAEWLAPALELGRKFALAWDDAKVRAGFIDFDDQIRQAAALLTRADLSEWIRYKLDRRIDHVLVDEAQDTNAAQWSIIDALTGDFFAGEGAQGDKLRTLFVVGDYKQAIFRFQGTSPENFEAARQRVRAALRGLADNVVELRRNQDARDLRELGLGQSFRTAQPVLDFVDQAIAGIGHAAFGLQEEPQPHVGEARPGHVALWRVVGAPKDADVDDEDEGEEGWLARSDRQLADRIARQMRQWMETGFPLAKGGARRATPGDVMILVRKRKELAGLIVARLHAAGVPVAGVDRLRLAAPLAVQDLLAALRFATQPLDDLTLANLLVSPLLGWSQQELLDHAWRPAGVRLWDHLRRSREPLVAATVAQLVDLLNQADRELPQALLHWLLLGDWQGRRKLVARLGHEANDPIDELLNAASAYAASGTASLLGFIRWFDAGEGELKREAGQAADEVRVMTVHGAKGLQAPIVILADAADNPDRSLASPLDLAETPPGADQPARSIPLPPLSKPDKLGPIAEAEARNAVAERQEHWRLLYVAMTRAEEALFVAGALGPKDRGIVPPDSWYARLAALLPEDRTIEDPIWGGRIEHGELAPLPPAGAAVTSPALPLLPPWLDRAAPAEPRPPRPLAPSQLGEDLAADPPWPPGTGAAAARRGVLIHRLLERLPDVAAPARQGAALGWLARIAPELTAPARDELVASALTVVADPAWAELFQPGSLAEVPIAANVGEQVVAGTIDRLLITPDRVRLVDYKTSRRPPESLDGVPVAILRQLAAYVAALEVTYPGRRIEAALLYTQTPRLIELPPALLAMHKPALSGDQ